MSKQAGEAFKSNIFNKVMSHTAPKKGPTQPAKAKKPGKPLGKGSKTPSASTAANNAAAVTQAAPKAKKSIARPKPEDIIENAPKSMVLSLYKQLLRRSRSLEYTDKDFFAQRMHYEFMKRKDVKDNNLYYIRGKWMLENNMGGLL